MSTLITHSHFYIPQLEKHRTVRVLLPRNYGKDHKLRFPVIYMLDGQNLFEPHTAAFQHWKLMEQMQRQPLYRQAILVGVDNGGADRISEYAPWTRGKNEGKASLYLEFLEKTLKPFIDHHYRTWSHAEATGIVGSSLAGLTSLYAGIEYQHTFGKIGAFSPSIWYNPQISAHLTNKIASGTKFYIAGSKTESPYMYKTLEKLYHSLDRSVLPKDHFRVVARDKGKHAESFWGREFKHMYEWLFPRTVL